MTEQGWLYALAFAVGDERLTKLGWTAQAHPGMRALDFLPHDTQGDLWASRTSNPRLAYTQTCLALGVAKVPRTRIDLPAARYGADVYVTQDFGPVRAAMRKATGKDPERYTSDWLADVLLIKHPQMFAPPTPYTRVDPMAAFRGAPPRAWTHDGKPIPRPGEQSIPIRRWRGMT